MKLTLHLLGQAYIEKDSARISLPFKKAEAVLFYLALEGARPKEKVKCLFWGDKDERQASGNLRNVIYLLRKHFPEHFEAKHGCLAVSGCTTDVDEICSSDEAEIPSFIFEEPLCGFEALDIGDFDEWLIYKRKQIRDRIVSWLKSRFFESSKRKDAGAGADCLNAMLRMDPFDESAVLELMRLHAADGQISKALSVYKDFSHRLRREADILPGGELRQFAKKLSMEFSAKNTSCDDCFCGRKNEVRQILDSAYHDNRMRLYFIYGEAGVGKTALINHVIKLMGPENIMAFHASPPPVGEGFDYSAWRGVVVRLVNLCREKELAIGREKLSILTRYFNDFSSEGYCRGAALLPPEREALVIAKIVADMTERLCEGKRPLFVLEDMHWFDASSLKLLSLFISELRVPAVFFMTSRPERSEAVIKLIYALRPPIKHSVLSIQLLPFTKDEVMYFCRLFLSEELIEERGESYFIRESAGMPLLLVEMAKMLRENGRAECRAGLRGLIMGRMEGLTEKEREALSILSVFGGPASAEDAALAAGIALEDISQPIETLLRRKMIRETEENGDFLLEFLHDNVRECIYDAMPKFKRKMTHQKIAEVLKRHYSPHKWSPALIEKLKYHYGMSGNELAVLELYLQEMSFHINLNHTLFPLIQDDVLLKCSLPFSDREETERKFTIILTLLHKCGYSDSSSLLFKKLEASYLEMYGGYKINWGEYEGGRRLTDAGLVSARECGFDEIELHCLEDIAHHYLQTDQSAELSKYGKEILALAGKLGKENHKGLAFRLIGMSQLIEGDYRGAESTFIESIKLFEALEMTGKFYTLSMLAPHCYIGEMHQWAGESGYAMKRYEYCLNRCRSAGLFWGQSHFHAHAADAALDMGDWDLLRAHIEEGVSLFESSQGGHCSSILYSLKAVCDARGGDFGAALRALEKADFLASIGKRSWCAAQLMAKAWVSALADDEGSGAEISGYLTHSAKEYAAQAVELYEAIGARRRIDFIKNMFM